MSMLRWTKRYPGDAIALGAIALNDQHQEMLALLNDLHSKAKIGGMQFGASDLLREIARLSSCHFAAQEALMESANYPEFAAHKAKHQEWTAILSALVDRHHQGDCAPYFQFLPLVLDWFPNHLAHEDSKYAAWLNAPEVNLRPQAGSALHPRPSSF